MKLPEIIVPKIRNVSLKSAMLLCMSVLISGCGSTGWMMCGDRGVQQTWTMGHGVKCYGDVMCGNKWVQPMCCCDNKICKDCQ